MRPGECEGEMLRRLAWTPLLDRLEMGCVSGWSRTAVYEAVRRLEDGGFAASIPHAADLTPPTRRYFLTANGLLRLALEEKATVDSLLRSRPVSAQWRRILMERLDAVAVIYRLASTVANADEHPVRLRLYRARPLDAAVMLPGGRNASTTKYSSGSSSSSCSSHTQQRRLFPVSQVHPVRPYVGVATLVEATTPSFLVLSLPTTLAVSRSLAGCGV